MSDDIFSVLTEEERAEFKNVIKTILNETDIDHERLYDFLFLSHKVLAYMVIEPLVYKLLDFAVERWNVKAGAKSGA